MIVITQVVPSVHIRCQRQHTIQLDHEEADALTYAVSHPRLKYSQEMLAVIILHDAVDGIDLRNRFKKMCSHIKESWLESNSGTPTKALRLELLGM